MEGQEDDMSIEVIAYEKYKLDWMVKHGKTIGDLICELSLSQQDDPNKSIASLFRNWEFDRGFNGEIWACFDEFLESEYQDEYYMRSLLTSAEWDEYASKRIPF